MKMYILVNEDIKISKGKVAGQVGHAVCTYLYKVFLRGFDNKIVNLTTEHYKFIDEYMKEQKKIILKCPQWKLEELERENKYIVIRDLGLTELEPNTLTCVCLGIFDNNSPDIPGFVRQLKLYH